MKLGHVVVGIVASLCAQMGGAAEVPDRVASRDAFAAAFEGARSQTRLVLLLSPT